jgi:hypothetical protein
MDYRLRSSPAAVLEAPCKFDQRQPDRITDPFQLQHIYSSLALFVLADTRLRDPEHLGKFRLTQFRLDSDAAKELEESFSIALSLGRESSDTLHILGA